MSKHSFDNQVSRPTSGRAAWLWDLERRRIVWANEAAVSFWGEETMLDLIAREFGAGDVSASSLAIAARAAESARNKPFAPDSHAHTGVCLRLKLIPEQSVLLTHCRVAHKQVAEGRGGLHVEVIEIEDAPKDPELHPDIVLARSAPVALALYDIQGRLIRENETSQGLFPSDSAHSLSHRLVGGQTATQLIHRTLADGLYSRTVRINSRFGVRRARITAQRSSHPQTSAPTLTISVLDVEDSLKMWGELAAKLEDRSRQQAELSESRHRDPAQPNVVALNPNLAVAATAHEPAIASQIVFHKMLNSLPWGVLSFGRTGQIDFANAAAQKILLGTAPANGDDLVGRKFVSLLNPITQKRVEKSLADAAKSARGSTLVYDMDSRFDVNRHTVRVRMTLLGISERNAPQYYAILTDQTSGTGPAQPAEDPISSQISDQLRYVASLSHDMRTPLNAIIGFSEIMKDERLGPIHNDRYRDYASDIHSSSGHLLSLVNDLLDFTKYKSGQLQVALRPTDLGEILAGAARLFDLECKRNGVSIKVDVAPGLPKVNVDPVLIERALLNVVSNAVKFSPKGEVVSLSARVLDSGSVCITVQDRGPGMSASDIELAMEPFRQTASSEKLAWERPHIRGTGLGLPLAKGLIEANRGSFMLKSQVGAGTTAAITFPVSQIVSSA